MTCLINGCDRPAETELVGVCCRQCLIVSQRGHTIAGLAHMSACDMRAAGKPVPNFGSGVAAITSLLGRGVTCKWLDAFSAELHTKSFYGYEVRVTIEETRR